MQYAETLGDSVEKLKQLYAANIKARYRHTIRKPKGNIYREVRKMLRLSQEDAGKLLNISRVAWQYRERTKVMYWPLELCILQRLSGLSPEQFLKLLNDIA